MSRTTPHVGRHARAVEPETFDEPPTTALPVVTPSDAPVAQAPDDEVTRALPVIPAQRVGPPSTHPDPSARVPAGYAPAGVYPVPPATPAPRRRILPAVLAVVTAVLLAAGIAIGVGGATGADLTDEPPASSATP